MTIVTVTIPRATAFDTTVPTSIAMGDTAATGSAVTAARRDHLHDVFSVASQSDMEAATTSTVPVVPAVARFAESALKAWVNMAGNGGNNDSYNITSTAKDDTGDYTVTIGVDMSGNAYVPQGNSEGDADVTVTFQIASATAFLVHTKEAGTAGDRNLFIAVAGTSS